MTRQEILQDALIAREAEVLGYQINIDNYTLALAHINAMPADEQREMEDFRVRLESLLCAEKHEQKKAGIMLAVIRQQVEG